MNLRTAPCAAIVAPLALLLAAGCKGNAPKVESTVTTAAASPTVPPSAAAPPVVSASASPSPAASVVAVASGGTAAAKLAALDGRPGSEAEYQAILTRLAAKTGGNEDAVAEGAITVHKATSVTCLQALQQMETAGTSAGAGAPAPPGPPSR